MVRQVAYVHLHADELRRGIIPYAVNRNAGIVVDLARDTVGKAFIQPFGRPWDADMVFSTHEAVDRSLACTGMDSGVVPADVIGEQGIELFQRMDSRDIKGRQPAAAEGPEVPFYFAFCSPISNRGMGFDNAQGIKDQGELVVFKRTAVIHVDLIRDTVSGNGLLEYFLIVVSVIVIKDPAADDQAGVVIDDHDQECPA